MTFKIRSEWSIGDREFSPATDDEIKREPMLFKCDLAHAYNLGGPLTHEFLDALPPDWRTGALIDSRAHMLMPGWYPCIPGWHHDDVPRTRKDGQPDYFNPAYCSQHVMGLWGDASLTNFALGEAEFPEVPFGSVCYREWHPIVERKIISGELTRCIAPERRLIYFNWNTWHEGTPATKNGWRFFIRATRNTTATAANEIRPQAQVYMSALMAGW